MPESNQEITEETKEEKKKMSGEQKWESIEEQLAEKLYGDKKQAKNVRFFSFCYDEDRPFYKRIFRNADWKSMSKESSENNSDLNADMMQAAKEGKLYVVSDQAPFLQKVNIDEKGKITLEEVTKNPIQIPQEASPEQKNAWSKLQNDFETLVEGNMSSTRNPATRWWKKRNATKIAEKIGEHIKDAAKNERSQLEKEARAQKKAEKQIKDQEKSHKFVKLDEQQLEKPKEQEQQRQEEPKAEEAKVEEPEAEGPEQGSKDLSDFEKAWDLVKQGKHQEAAGLIAQEMQKLSDQFMKEKFMTDKAIKFGMELKQQMEKLEKSGEVELLDKLKENPIYKENREIYQGQANLAEMGKLGEEAHKRLEKQSEEQKPNREDLLDMIAAEFASNILIKNALEKDVSQEIKSIANQPSGQKVMDEIKDAIRGTDTINGLMEGTTKELQNMFSKNFTRQSLYNEANREVANKQKRKEAQKEHQMEKQPHVLENKEKQAPSMNK